MQDTTIRKVDETGGLGGIFEIKIYENQADFEKGKYKSRDRRHNKMTNASLAVISGLIGNTGSQTAFGYLALGSGTTAVSAAHTTLVTEFSTIGLSRTASTNSRTTTTQTNDTLALAATWNVTGSGSIEEIGIFNASSSGTMLARALTTTKAVINGNVVTATYSIVFVGN